MSRVLTPAEYARVNALLGAGALTVSLLGMWAGIDRLIDAWRTMCPRTS